MDRRELCPNKHILPEFLQVTLNFSLPDENALATRLPLCPLATARLLGLGRVGLLVYDFPGSSLASAVRHCNAQPAFVFRAAPSDCAPWTDRWDCTAVTERPCLPQQKSLRTGAVHILLRAAGK
jgi:hypothetical protein